MIVRAILILFIVNVATSTEGAVVNGDAFGTGANTFQIEFTTIGNPGNPDNSVVTSRNLDGSPHTIIQIGSVPYAFRIGKFEVSRDSVIKANALGGLGIILEDLTSFGGNGLNRPATGINWNEAARFINWLNTSTGSPPAYKFAVQPGQTGYDPNANIQLWLPNDAGYNPSNLYRNSLARYFLPSLDEWHKAAYYDPSGTYHTYATGSNITPTKVAGGTAAGTAVYDQSVFKGPADVDFAGGLSPYGTMGQSGNVHEWEETAHNLTNNSGSASRGYSGGDWDDSAFRLSSEGRSGDTPLLQFRTIGFRVASAVPEPSTVVFTIAAFAAMATRRRQSFAHNRG